MRVVPALNVRPGQDPVVTLTIDGHAVSFTPESARTVGHLLLDLGGDAVEARSLAALMARCGVGPDKAAEVVREHCRCLEAARGAKVYEPGATGGPTS